MESQTISGAGRSEEAISVGAQGRGRGIREPPEKERDLQPGGGARWSRATPRQRRKWKHSREKKVNEYLLDTGKSGLN